MLIVRSFGFVAPVKNFCEKLRAGRKLAAMFFGVEWASGKCIGYVTIYMQDLDNFKRNLNDHNRPSEVFIYNIFFFFPFDYIKYSTVKVRTIMNFHDITRENRKSFPLCQLMKGVLNVRIIAFLQFFSPSHYARL